MLAGPSFPAILEAVFAQHLLGNLKNIKIGRYLIILKLVLLSMRPEQWIKNLIVFAANNAANIVPTLPLPNIARAMP